MARTGSDRDHAARVNVTCVPAHVELGRRQSPEDVILHDLARRLCSRRVLATAASFALLTSVASTAPAPARTSGPSIAQLGGFAVAAGITSIQSTTGGGVWGDVSFTPSFALHGRAQWMTAPGVSIGQFAAGIHATFVRRKGWSLYGVGLPGWYHLGHLANSHTLIRSHFSLNLGLGVEFPITSKIAGRVEVDRDLHALPPVILTDHFDDFTATTIIPGQNVSGWNLSGGAVLAFGRPIAEASASSNPASKWATGVQLGLASAPSSDAVGTLGAFISYSVTRHINLDATVSGAGSSNEPARLYGTGRLTLAFAGVKIGTRIGPLGAFFKFRAGIASSAGVGTPTAIVGTTRATAAAYDLGGVVEVAISRSSFVRCDLGEVVSYLSLVDPHLEGVLVPNPLSSNSVYVLPISVGIGWRF